MFEYVKTLLSHIVHSSVTINTRITTAARYFSVRFCAIFHSGEIGKSTIPINFNCARNNKERMFFFAYDMIGTVLVLAINSCIDFMLAHYLFVHALLIIYTQTHTSDFAERTNNNAQHVWWYDDAYIRLSVRLSIKYIIWYVSKSNDRQQQTKHQTATQRQLKCGLMISLPHTCVNMYMCSCVFSIGMFRDECGLPNDIVYYAFMYGSNFKPNRLTGNHKLNNTIHTYFVISHRASVTHGVHDVLGVHTSARLLTKHTPTK